MEGATAKHAIARVGDRGIAVGVACVAAIALVAWPVRSIHPRGGADWNWVAALSYIAKHGLNFGEQVVWSYGPLGFLNTYYGPVLYYGDVLLLSWLFAALLQVLLAGTLLFALRRSLPLAGAAIAAVVVLAPTHNRVPALALAWCVLALTREREYSAPRELPAAAFPFALGALTGLAVLGKLNQGVELVVLAGVVLAARRHRGDALAFAGALLASAAAGWLATGQRLADVWPYLRNSAEVVAGYPAAMGIATPAYGWTYAAALGLIALALTLGWDAGRGALPRIRWGLLALCVVYAGFTFKEAFVRQDAIHVEEFFADLLVLFAVLPLRPSRLPLQLGGVAAGLVALVAISGVQDVGRTLNPYANAKAAGDQVRTLASSARRAAIVADVRAGVAEGYAVSPQLIEAIGRRSVMFWPYLYGEIAYAYDLDFQPLPTLETYATYTPTLDRLGARMLASAHAPQRIVRADAPAVDGRFPSFEAPLATLEILCHYRQIATYDLWQLLARVRDRCGATRTIRTATAGWGESIAVPKPARRGALVLV
ncbi:MAG: hypothetical protein WBC33_07400, partial [Conexibacter sp.]